MSEGLTFRGELFSRAARWACNGAVVPRAPAGAELAAAALVTRRDQPRGILQDESLRIGANCQDVICRRTLFEF